MTTVRVDTPDIYILINYLYGLSEESKKKKECKWIKKSFHLIFILYSFQLNTKTLMKMKNELAIKINMDIAKCFFISSIKRW